MTNYIDYLSRIESSDIFINCLDIATYPNKHLTTNESPKEEKSSK